MGQLVLDDSQTGNHQDLLYWYLMRRMELQTCWEVEGNYLELDSCTSWTGMSLIPLSLIHLGLTGVLDSWVSLFFLACLAKPHLLLIGTSLEKRRGQGRALCFQGLGSSPLSSVLLRALWLVFCWGRDFGPFQRLWVLSWLTWGYFVASWKICPTIIRVEFIK